MILRQSGDTAKKAGRARKARSEFWKRYAAKAKKKKEKKS